MLFYQMFIKLFCHIFLALDLIHEYMLEKSLKLLLHIPKRFNAFQVLKWILLLLEVTCVIFACTTNTDVWQTIVARATKSQKNCSTPPEGIGSVCTPPEGIGSVCTPPEGIGSVCTPPEGIGSVWKSHSYAVAWKRNLIK